MQQYHKPRKIGWIDGTKHNILLRLGEIVPACIMWPWLMMFSQRALLQSDAYERYMLVALNRLR
jgi:hypothetical protein